jgi:hypothetical protein
LKRVTHTLSHDTAVMQGTQDGRPLPEALAIEREQTVLIVDSWHE